MLDEEVHRCCCDCENVLVLQRRVLALSVTLDYNYDALAIVRIWAEAERPTGFSVSELFNTRLHKDIGIIACGQYWEALLIPLLFNTDHWRLGYFGGGEHEPQDCQPHRPRNRDETQHTQHSREPLSRQNRGLRRRLEHV